MLRLDWGAKVLIVLRLGIAEIVNRGHVAVGRLIPWLERIGWQRSGLAVE